MPSVPYSTDDFLAASSFLSTQLWKDEAAEKFWLRWLQAHPDQATKFYEAAALLHQLMPGPRTEPKVEVKAAEVAKFWAAVRSAGPAGQ